MLPASNPPSRQHSRSPDNGPLPQGKPQAIPEQGPTRKKKKGKNGPGREVGSAKNAAKAAPEDV